MRFTSAERSASQESADSPAPPSEFSPLATTRSIEWRAMSLGTKWRTAWTPGFPTTSPMKSTLSNQPSCRAARPEEGGGSLRGSEVGVPVQPSERLVLGYHEIHRHVVSVR